MIAASAAQNHNLEIRRRENKYYGHTTYKGHKYVDFPILFYNSDHLFELQGILRTTS